MNGSGDFTPSEEHMRRLTHVVQRSRLRHAKAVNTLPNGEIDDLDDMGRTLDRAIADAVAAEVWP